MSTTTTGIPETGTDSALILKERYIVTIEVPKRHYESLCEYLKKKVAGLEVRDRVMRGLSVISDLEVLTPEAKERLRELLILEAQVRGLKMRRR